MKKNNFYIKNKARLGKEIRKKEFWNLNLITLVGLIVLHYGFIEKNFNFVQILERLCKLIISFFKLSFC